MSRLRTSSTSTPMGRRVRKLTFIYPLEMVMSSLLSGKGSLPYPGSLSAVISFTFFVSTSCMSRIFTAWSYPA